MAIRPSTKLLAHIRRRPLVPLLLAATVCVDAVALLVIPWLRLEFQYEDIPWLALTCGQLGLLAMWSTWRRRYWVWRVLVMIAAVLAFGISIDDPPGATAYATFGGLYAGSIFLISLCVRFLVRPYARRDQERRIKLRFSVSFALALTTVVAVLSALARRFNSSILNSDVVILVFVEAILAGMCLFLTRRYRAPAVAIVGAIVTVLSLTFFSSVVVDSNYSVKTTVIYGAFMATAAAQYLIWLFAVRVRCAPRWKHKPALTTDA